MKPHKLLLKNIGPFIGTTEIDFSRLGDIFLICGKTGSGKTTILDAMCYALYGEVPGSRSGLKTTMLRSDFVSQTDDFLVSLEFSIGAAFYKIERFPPQMYTTNRGTISEKPEEAILYHKEGQTWLAIPGKLSETDAAIRALIKLSSQEFNRIVLLPQGEFADFLRLNSNKRREALAKLFPAELCKTITAKADQRWKEYSAELSQIEQQLSQIRVDFDPTTVDEKISQLSQEEHTTQDEQKKLQSSLLTISTNVEKLRQTSAQSTQNQLKIEQLAQSIDATKQEQKRLNSECAELEKQEAAITQITEENRSLDIQLHELEKALSLETQLLSTAKELSQVQTEQKNLQAQIQELQTALVPMQTILDETAQISDSLPELQETDAQATKELQRIKEESDLMAHLIAEQKRIDEITGSLSRHSAKQQELEQQHLHLRDTLQKLEEEKKLGELQESASVIALTLQNKQECPVCGSLDHPKPAQKPGADFFLLHKKIEAQKESITRVEKELLEVQKMISGLQTRKEEIAASTQNKQLTLPLQTSAEEVQVLLAKASANKQAAKTALDIANRNLAKRSKTEREKKQLEYTIAPLQHEATNMAARHAGLTAEKQQLEKQLKAIMPEASQTAKERQKMLSAKLQLNKTAIETHAQLKKRNAEKTAQLAGTLEQLQNSHSQAAFDQEQLDAALQHALQAFPHITYNSPISALTATVQIKQIESDLSSIQVQLDSANQRLQDLAVQKKSLEELQKRWHTLEQKRQHVSTKSAPFAALAKDLSGNNPKSTDFESWLLGLYLEEITIHASTRLERISEGRYKLLLKTEKSSRQRFAGLDLEIFDAYTGKTRPCESLSGGETFMASISLALALTDVVQSKSGGIQLESLFIDEGFGSLDEATLEKSLSILDEIRGSRLVGLISHVGELKNRIPSRIELDKTSSGTRIKIVSI